MFTLHSYTGHVPQMKYQHSETNGNTSARILSDYRGKKLHDSTLGLHGRGGDAQLPFPTYYDHDPTRVIGTRSRTWERWRPAHNYDLLNTSPRDEELREFHKVQRLFCIIFYTITWLLCAYPLLLVCDKLKDTRKSDVKSTSDHVSWRVFPTHLKSAKDLQTRLLYKYLFFSNLI